MFAAKQQRIHPPLLPGPAAWGFARATAVKPSPPAPPRLGVRTAALTAFPRSPRPCAAGRII